MSSKINLSHLVFLAGTAALGGLLFGFDIAIITGAGPFLIRHFHLSDLSLGWAFSSLLFGCVVGSAVAGRITDRYGRRRVLLAVGLLFAASSLATGTAPSFSVFVIARFVGGLAVGAASLVSPMYVSEISPPSLRGRMGTFYQISIVTGSLVSFFINYLLRNAGPDNWRWMFVTGVVPSLAFLILLQFAPDTPQYLCMAGRPEEGFAILERIVGREAAVAEMVEIEASLRAKRARWRDLLQPGTRRAVAVSFFLAILVQVSGINTIVDYAPAIFRSAGWSMDTALLSTLVIGVTCFFFTLFSFLMIDRYGRRPMYIAGSAGMALGLLALAAAALAGRFHGAIVLAALLLFLAFFESCVGPVFWTLMPEILPNRVRGTAMTVPVLTQWVANALVVLFFPLAFDRIGKAATFTFLAAMAVVQAVVTYFFVPETKNASLEEIETFWGGRNSSSRVLQPTERR